MQSPQGVLLSEAHYKRRKALTLLISVGKLCLYLRPFPKVYTAGKTDLYRLHTDTGETAEQEAERWRQWVIVWTAFIKCSEPVTRQVKATEE